MDSLGRSTFRYEFENVIRIVTALKLLAGGKTEITFDRPLDFNHSGTAPYRGEVGLLSRNVRFETELLGVSQSTIKNDVSSRKFSHTLW